MRSDNLNREKLLEIGIQKRNKEIDLTWQEIANQYGGDIFNDGESFRKWVFDQVRKENAQKQLKKNNNKTEISENSFKDSVEIKSDGSQTSNKLIRMSIEDSKDPDFLLQAHGYDKEAWELTSARSNIWNSYSKKDGIMQLYSSKISVKPKKDELTLEDVSRLFAEMGSNYQSPVHKPTRYNANGKMLEVNISDLHLGKIARQDTSNDEYNYEIAKERFLFVINDVIRKTSQHSFEKILFIYSQDFFHFDGLSQSTTKGTRMESDLRWTELFKLGVELLVEGIDLLSQVAPVKTLYIASNHDQQISYYAIEYLYAWYRNNPNVTIDNSARSRKYVEFGQNLLGFAHGHNERKRLPFLMPVEAKEAWSRTAYREFHLGHLHSEQLTTEENGIIIRHISSVAGTDTWHHDLGYVGAIKRTQSFIYDKEEGLTDIIYTSVM